MDGFWPVIYFAVFLKIPVLFSIWILWYVTRGEDQPLAHEEEHGGPGPKRPHPRPPRPVGPRRGAHAEAPLPAPARVRLKPRQRVAGRAGARD